MICRVCTEPMTLDPLIARDALRGLDPGMPTPIVVKCRNGHSQRLNTRIADSTPPTRRETPRCAVCGVEIPRQKGAAPRKSCSPEHKRFIEVKRAEARQLHRGRTGAFHFPLELQPWYRGGVTAFKAPPRQVVTVWPLFPEIPTCWLEGFRALYPVLDEPEPVLPATFPPLEVEADALFSGVPRKRRPRGRPRREVLAEAQA